METIGGNIFELDPGLNFQSSRLREFYRMWDTKRAGREMPARRDFDPLEFGALLGFVSLTGVSYVGDLPRFRYRLIGTSITQVVGRDASGRWLDEIYSADAYRKVVVGFEWILKHRRPIRAKGTLRHANRDWLAVELIDAPLSSDGRQIDMFISCLEFTN